MVPAIKFFVHFSSNTRHHDDIWMNSLVVNSPHQSRAGGAFEHNYGANHNISSSDMGNDAALQRPAL